MRADAGEEATAEQLHARWQHACQLHSSSPIAHQDRHRGEFSDKKNLELLLHLLTDQFLPPQHHSGEYGGHSCTRGRHQPKKTTITALRRPCSRTDAGGNIRPQHPSTCSFQKSSRHRPLSPSLGSCPAKQLNTIGPCEATRQQALRKSERGGEGWMGASQYGSVYYTWNI
jgi:hypothetical protein